MKESTKKHLFGSLTSAKSILAAMELVKQGKVYNLAKTLEIGIPLGAHGELFYSNTWSYGVVRKRTPSKNELGFLSCRVEMPDHTGTHIDALNHISIGDKLYGGVSASEVLGVSGTSDLGADQLPSIICPAVMVDIAGYKGKSILPSGYVITPDDIEGAIVKQKTDGRAPPAVFLNTGWENLWMVDNAKFIASEPGIGMEAGKWLTRHHVRVVGSDNNAVEVKPFEDKDTFWPVHQHMITRSGMLVLENMNLKELARDRVYEFLFVCSPLPLKGGSASPVAPLAVV